MVNGQSGRGWEWTEEQRDSLKRWHTPLDKIYRQVSRLVVDVRASLPEYGHDAHSSAKEFMDGASDLLKLDPRRKGRKWQHIPHSVVAEKVERVMTLHQEFAVGFLKRKDFQEAIKYKNQIATVAHDGEIERKLSEVSKLTESRETLAASASKWSDQLRQFGQVVYGLRGDSKLSGSEVIALNHWLAVKYILIAANMAPSVREYVVKSVKDGSDIDELIREVHLRLIEQAVAVYKSEIRKGKSLMNAAGYRSPAEAYFKVVLKTIRRLLTEMSPAQAEQLPSKWDCSINGINIDSRR